MAQVSNQVQELHAAGNMLTLLSMQPDLDPATQAVLREICQCVRRALRPVLEGPSDIDLGEVCMQAITLCHQLYGCVPITWASCESDLTIVRIRGRKHPLYLAILDLLLNALEVIDLDGDGQITVMLITQPTYQELIIQDNGPGLPTDAIAQLQQVFPMGSTKATGFGIGLPTAMTTFDSMGALVEVTTADRGTTFRIQFPTIGSSYES